MCIVIRTESCAEYPTKYASNLDFIEKVRGVPCFLLFHRNFCIFPTVEPSKTTEDIRLITERTLVYQE